MVYTNQGKEKLQQDITNNQPLTVDYQMILYTNVITPTATTVLGDLTQPTAAGYTIQTIPGAGWVVTDGEAVAPATSFIMTEAETIYGYGLVFDGVLLAAGNFTEGPFILPAAGGQVIVNFTQNLS